MRLKNKGFSLVELLVAIAAFAIVMVGIISLMRSSSIMFRNESMEVDLEKDSQVLLAQIEELIVDCKTISSVSDPGATVAYSVTEPNGTSHSLKQIGNNILLDGEILADNIDYFFVNGLQANDGLADNVCMLDVKLNSKAGGNTGKEFTYTGYKQVYFRNDIDHVISSGLPDLDTATPGPGPGNEKTLVLGRYEVANLNERFGLATVESWTPSGNDGIAFCDTTALDAHGGLTSVSYLTSGYSIYITTNTTCNSDTINAYSGVLTGKKANADGTPSDTLVTVNVSVPKVELKQGSGIVEVPCVEVNNTNDKGSGGFYSYVEFTGFCVRDYERYFSSVPGSGFSPVTGKLEVTLNGASKGSMTGNVINCLSQNFASGFGGQIQMGGGGWNRAEQFGLFYDFENPGYLVIKWHNGDKPSAAYLASNTVKMNVTVTYPHNGGSASQTKDFRMYTGGSSLSGL